METRCPSRTESRPGPRPASRGRRRRAPSAGRAAPLRSSAPRAPRAGSSDRTEAGGGCTEASRGASASCSRTVCTARPPDSTGLDSSATVLARQRVEHAPVRGGSEAANLDSRRPRRRPFRRRLLVFGIDAALEEGLEPLVHPGPPQTPLDDRVHRKRRKVAFVETDGIAQGNGSGLVGLGAHRVEDRLGPLAISQVSGRERLPVERYGRFHHWKIYVQRRC